MELAAAAEDDTAAGVRSSPPVFSSGSVRRLRGRRSRTNERHCGIALSRTLILLTVLASALGAGCATSSVSAPETAVSLEPKIEPTPTVELTATSTPRLLLTSTPSPDPTKVALQFRQYGVYSDPEFIMAYLPDGRFFYIIQGAIRVRNDSDPRPDSFELTGSINIVGKLTDADTVEGRVLTSIPGREIEIKYNAKLQGTGWNAIIEAERQRRLNKFGISSSSAEIEQYILQQLRDVCRCEPPPR